MLQANMSICADQLLFIRRVFHFIKQFKMCNYDIQTCPSMMIFY